jgi:hypothetical protein
MVSLLGKINNLIRSKRKILFCFFFFFLAGISYFLGSNIGYSLIENAMTERITALFILYKPAQSFQGAYRHLNSENELIRLSGYYFLLENQMINDDFLIERYAAETNEVNKRTLIWLLGYSSNQKAVIAFYNTIFQNSSLRIQKEILRSVQRFGDESVKDFIQKQKVSGDILEGL